MEKQFYIHPNFEDAMHRLRDEGQTNLYLYYYTNPNTFFKILDNRCIKSSKYDNVNDLDEANLDCLNGIFRRFEIEKYIKDNCHFISFVRDYKKHNVTIEGTQHPRMWAQYAQNSEGVCLILNKRELLKKCRIARGRKSIMMGNVYYRWAKCSYEKPEEINAFCTNSPIEVILRKYSKQIFLTKHVDWEQEHETRLCIFDNQEDDMICIDGCIEGICLGKKFMDNSECMVKLAEHLASSNKKFYNHINTDAFGVIASTDGGYDAWAIHPNIDVRIDEIIKSLNSLLM